jgi:hypothetical protein
MFIAAPIAAALNSQRVHFEVAGMSQRSLPALASLSIEDWDSPEEHRCFGELISFLVERGARVKSHE